MSKDSRLREALPDMFELVLVPGRNDGQQMLVLTEQGMAIADSAVAEAVLSKPVYCPRVTPPDQWEAFTMKPSEHERVPEQYFERAGPTTLGSTVLAHD
jgi:hypothetical protein